MYSLCSTSNWCWACVTMVSWITFWEVNHTTREPAITPARLEIKSVTPCCCQGKFTTVNSSIANHSTERGKGSQSGTAISRIEECRKHLSGRSGRLLPDQEGLKVNEEEKGDPGAFCPWVIEIKRVSSLSPRQSKSLVILQFLVVCVSNIQDKMHTIKNKFHPTALYRPFPVIIRLFSLSPNSRASILSSCFDEAPKSFESA